MDIQNRSTNGDPNNPPRPSTKFWAVLRKHLAICSEHYRQPVSELSAIAYAEDLMDLTPEELDAAWVEARRTSEFMPVSATIRAAHEKLRSSGAGDYLGPRLLSYPEVTKEERDAALQFSDNLKKKLGVGTLSEAIEKKRPEVTERSPRGKTPPRIVRSVEEQKTELRRRGFLK